MVTIESILLIKNIKTVHFNLDRADTGKQSHKLS